MPVWQSYNVQLWFEALAFSNGDPNLSKRWKMVTQWSKLKPVTTYMYIINNKLTWSELVRLRSTLVHAKHYDMKVPDMIASRSRERIVIFDPPREQNAKIFTALYIQIGDYELTWWDQRSTSFEQHTNRELRTTTTIQNQRIQIQTCK